MYLDFGDARNDAVSAISSGSPKSPSDLPVIFSARLIFQFEFSLVCSLFESGICIFAMIFI